jgi:hypothetical protein
VSARRWVVAVTLAVFLVTASSPPASAKSQKAIWGPVRMPDGSSAFPIYRDLGVRVLQLYLNWDDVAPEPPQTPTDPQDPVYRWPAHIDEAVKKARRYRIQILLLVWRSPRWANGRRDPNWAPDDDAYADFLTATSKRYPSVRRWMIWGEPNRRDNFQPLPRASLVGPERYARLLAAGYHALKQRSRRNIVIGGNTMSFGEVYPRDFAQWMTLLPSRKPPPLDLYGHNPFTTRFPDLSDTGFAGYPAARDIGDIDTFYRELRAIYRGQYRRFKTRGPRLWLSEFTISSDRGNRAHREYVSRADQARWLTAAYRIARRSPWIAGLGWFNLHDDPRGEPGGLTTGLMTYEGKRKPAYYAYRRAR